MGCVTYLLDYVLLKGRISLKKMRCSLYITGTLTCGSTLRISSKSAAFPFFILELDFQLLSEPGSQRGYGLLSLPTLHGHEGQC